MARPKGAAGTEITESTVESAAADDDDDDDDEEEEEEEEEASSCVLLLPSINRNILVYSISPIFAYMYL